MIPAGSPLQHVVVDAGHGGHDPGASHFGLQEKVLALDIALRLGEALQRRGLTVTLTRQEDRFIELSERIALANRLGADLFVSVHLNAHRDPAIRGVEVYYPRVSVVAADADWPPEVRAEEVAMPSTQIKQLLWDLVLGSTRSQSRQLGTEVCHALREALPAPCLGVKPARFVVLREAWMPAILVEGGFLSHAQEAQVLNTPAYRQRAAEAIANGVVAYAQRHH
jgi:N-acetylmuramoyl-L-alanine amidase